MAALNPFIIGCEIIFARTSGSTPWLPGPARVRALSNAYISRERAERRQRSSKNCGWRLRAVPSKRHGSASRKLPAEAAFLTRKRCEGLSIVGLVSVHKIIGTNSEAGKSTEPIDPRAIYCLNRAEPDGDAPLTRRPPFSSLQLDLIPCLQRTNDRYPAAYNGLVAGSSPAGPTSLRSLRPSKPVPRIPSEASEGCHAEARRAKADRCRE